MSFGTQYTLLATLSAAARFRIHGPQRLAVDIAWSLVRLRTGVREASVGTDVEIREADGGKGLGVYALRPLEPVACLTRYTGEHRSRERHDAVCASGKSSSSYAIGLGKNWVVDAEDARTSGWARYINHSLRAQNCIFVPCGLDSIAPGILPPADEPFCVYVQVSRPIAEGEELLLDYGGNYWDERVPREGVLGVLRRLKIDYV